MSQRSDGRLSESDGNESEGGSDRHRRKKEKKEKRRLAKASEDESASKRLADLEDRLANANSELAEKTKAHNRAVSESQKQLNEEAR